MIRQVVVIDGNNAAHRMLHALPGLENRAGRPTAVLYGVMNMLRTVFDGFDPDAIVVAWDSPATPWRKSIYPEYKANREARAEERTVMDQLAYEAFYRVQIPDTMKALEGLGITQVMGVQLEADDIIGAIARNNHRALITIASSDKDMYQLAWSDRVRIWNPVTGFFVSQNKDGRLEKSGGPSIHAACIAPSPVTYLLWRTIIGDASDGIRGIDGVGEKTVADLLYLPWDGAEDLRMYLGRLGMRGKRGQAIHDGVPIILRNLKIMSLLADPAHVYNHFSNRDLNLLQGRSMGRVEKTPKLLRKYRIAALSPLSLFFSRLGFDFAAWDDSCEDVRRMFVKLWNRTQMMRVCGTWPVPVGPWNDMPLVRMEEQHT